MKGSLASTYNIHPSKATRKKIAWQWPIELNDMVSASMQVLSSVKQKREPSSNYFLLDYDFSPLISTTPVKKALHSEILYL